MWRPIIGMYVVSETYLETTHNRKWLRAWSMQDQTVAYLNASCNAIRIHVTFVRASTVGTSQKELCLCITPTARARRRPPARACARKSRGFLSTGCATARAVDWLQECGLQPPNSFGLPHSYRERVRTRTQLDSSSPTANPTT